MKQAAQLQARMAALQQELETIEVSGAAGGGLVTVTITAKGDLKAVQIDDSLMKPDEKEILEDLLVTAFSDAKKKSETVVQEKMKSLTGGLSLPAGLNPFG
jgi:nucleoid-associated protein EbfC